MIILDFLVIAFLAHVTGKIKSPSLRMIWHAIGVVNMLLLIIAIRYNS